LVVVSP